jgi:hypothetical protein
MDYFRAAFGGFAPHRDEDAAVKFALNVVLNDNRLQELAGLVVDGSQFGGIEGEPGGTLERRDIADEGSKAYPDWPAGARFNASVDEDAYRLEYPEFFMSRETFMKYLLPAIDACAAADPSTARAPSLVALRKATE